MGKAIVTEKAPPPKPKRRRKKREEDTRGLFKKLALKILAIVAPAMSEPDPWYMPPGPLDDTQRLLLRERHTQATVWQQQHHQAFHHQPRNHLSPRF